MLEATDHKEKLNLFMPIQRKDIFPLGEGVDTDALASSFLSNDKAS